MKRYLVEFIGTFFLVFTVCFASVIQDHSSAALGIGAIYMAMVYAGGHISGGHYNPAVSLAALLRGKMASSDFTFYVLCQIIGGMSAAFLCRTLLTDDSSQRPMEPGMAALVGEFLFTFALAWVALNVATARGTAGNSFYGLAIGFTLAAGVIAVGKFSGGAFNPATALSFVLLSKLTLGTVIKYVVAHFVAGAAAAFVFKFVNGKD